MSASDHLASWCCTTVLPAPKGPGMAAQPPLPTGKSVSMTLWPVTSGRSMGRRSVKGLGSRTGQRWRERKRRAARRARRPHRRWAPLPCSCPRASRPRRRPETRGGTMERCSVISLSRQRAKNCAGLELVALLYEHLHVPELLLVQALDVDALGDEAAARMPLWPAAGGRCRRRCRLSRPGPRRTDMGSFVGYTGSPGGEPAGVLVYLHDALLPGGGDDLAEEALLADVDKAHARQAAAPAHL